MFPRKLTSIDGEGQTERRNSRNRERIILAIGDENVKKLLVEFEVDTIWFQYKVFDNLINSVMFFFKYGNYYHWKTNIFLLLPQQRRYVSHVPPRVSSVPPRVRSVPPRVRSVPPRVSPVPPRVSPSHLELAPSHLDLDLPHLELDP